MQKIAVSLIFALLSLGAQVASAQAYYPQYSSNMYTASYSGGCINLTRDLSYGSRNSDVTALQRFLVAQNYPGGGSWMISGYFGKATQAAVQIFQQQNGLTQSGWVDGNTRAAISNITCGYGNINYNNYSNYNNGYPYNYNNNPYNYNQNCLTIYPYTCNNNYNYGTVHVNSLSSTYGQPGTSVTIYGNGFDSSGNTIYLGTQNLGTFYSSSGTSLTFTVPYNGASGSNSVYVTNSHGTSNSLTFTVTNYNSNCNVYPYNCNNYGNVHIDSLSSTYGQAGNSVTIYGNGFDYSGNTVYFGNQSLGTFNSSNGTSLSFTIPYNTNSGSVSVYVSNSRGTSNSLTFNVTSYNNNNNGNCYPYPWSCGNQPPYTPCNSYQNQYGYTYCPTGSVQINSLQPNAGATGSTVTIYGSGFDRYNNNVNVGGYTLINIPSVDGTTLQFTVPQLSGSNTSVPVYVVSSRGTSNTLYFTLNPSNCSYPYYNCNVNNNAPTIVAVTGPTNLQSNTQGSWTISFNPQNSYNTTVSANWGDSTSNNTQTTYNSNIQTFTFNHTYVSNGTYTITFTVSNNNGQQNTTTTTVIVTNNGNNGSLALNSLSPNSGHVGMQIQLNGNGFTSDNTVHFGIGGTQHLSSPNGSYLYFTIPSYVSPCDVGGSCVTPTQVTNGSYNVYVTNSNGTTQTLTFQVN